MTNFKVLSVNISEKKGTVKTPAGTIELTDTGVRNDAHAGKWHRQVSLLAGESIKKAEEAASTHFEYGIFAENITTEGLELHKTNILDRFANDTVELEVTQIGKKCHAKCAIGTLVGDCIMPLEGIFARVKRAGKLSDGDILTYLPKTFTVTVITLSDRAASGEYEDRSGEKIREHISEWAAESNLRISIDPSVIPDEKEILEKEIRHSLDKGSDVVITTGSTGISTRDIAPETLLPMLDKELPGIMDMIRYKYGSEKPHALLSRSLAGTINKCLVFALPGSPKAVDEYMTEIRKILFHSILMINDIGQH